MYVHSFVRPLGFRVSFAFIRRFVLRGGSSGGGSCGNYGGGGGHGGGGGSGVRLGHGSGGAWRGQRCRQRWSAPEALVVAVAATMECGGGGRRRPLGRSEERERGARSTRPHLDGGDNSDRGRSRSAAASTAMTAVVAAALLAMMACAAERSIEKLLSVGAGKPMRRYL